jgi:hypothetical protein
MEVKTMNKEYKPVQQGLLTLINRYQDGVRKDGGVPRTSEFVKRCLTRYGLPGAFQSYIRINERRADKQRILLESNFTGGKEKSDRVKNAENKLLSLLFEFVVTPVETVATMVGQGKQIQTVNQSLGAADWGGGGGSSYSSSSFLGSNEGNDPNQRTYG